MTDKEIVQYYGQIWGNVKHLKSYLKELRERYKRENENEVDRRRREKTHYCDTQKEDAEKAYNDL